MFHNHKQGRKSIYRVLCLLLAIVLLMGNTVIAVSDEVKNAYTLIDHGRENNYFNRLGVVPDGESTEYLAYCIDPDVDFNSEYMGYIAGNLNTDMKAALEALLRNTYPVLTTSQIDMVWNTTGISESEAYDATQCAIWHIISGYTYQVPDDLLSPNAQILYNALISGSNYLNEEFVFESNYSSASASSVNHTYSRFGPFSFSFGSGNTNLDSKIRVVYEKGSGDSDYEVVNASGTVVSALQFNTDYYFRYIKTDGIIANPAFSLSVEIADISEFIPLESIMGKDLVQSVAYVTTKDRDMTVSDVSHNDTGLTIGNIEVIKGLRVTDLSSPATIFPEDSISRSEGMSGADITASSYSYPEDLIQIPQQITFKIFWWDKNAGAWNTAPVSSKTIQLSQSSTDLSGSVADGYSSGSGILTGLVVGEKYLLVEEWALGTQYADEITVVEGYDAQSRPIETTTTKTYYYTSSSTVLSSGLSSREINAKSSTNYNINTPSGTLGVNTVEFIYDATITEIEIENGLEIGFHDESSFEELAPLSLTLTKKLRLYESATANSTYPIYLYKLEAGKWTLVGTKNITPWNNAAPNLDLMKWTVTGLVNGGEYMLVEAWRTGFWSEPVSDPDWDWLYDYDNTASFSGTGFASGSYVYILTSAGIGGSTFNGTLNTTQPYQAHYTGYRFTLTNNAEFLVENEATLNMMQMSPVMKPPAEQKLTFEKNYYVNGVAKTGTPFSFSWFYDDEFDDYERKYNSGAAYIFTANSWFTFSKFSIYENWLNGRFVDYQYIYGDETTEYLRKATTTIRDTQASTTQSQASTSLRYIDGTTGSWSTSKAGMDTWYAAMELSNFQNATAMGSVGLTHIRFNNYETTTTAYEVSPGYGVAAIIKRDGDTLSTSGMNGAEFDIIRKDTGEVIIANWTLSSTNYIQLLGTSTYYYVTPVLENGDYLLVEKKAPSGYNLTLSDSSSYEINVNGIPSNTASVVTINNYATNGERTIRLNKTNHLGTALAGSAFSFTNNETGTVYSLDMTSSSSKTITLPFGEYTVSETTLPNGVVEAAEDVVITVSPSGWPKSVIKDFTIENTQTGSFNLFKHDRKNSIASLPGAVFEIFRVTGSGEQELVLELTTGDVFSSLSGLPFGTYKIKEKASPNGYLASDREYTIVINSLSSKTIHIFNDKVPVAYGRIQIQKTDEKSNAVGPATFELWDTQGRLLDTFVTDENGLYKSTFLPVGDYILIETEGPEGYLLDATPIEVSVTKDVVASIIHVNKHESTEPPITLPEFPSTPNPNPEPPPTTTPTPEPKPEPSPTPETEVTSPPTTEPSPEVEKPKVDEFITINHPDGTQPPLIIGKEKTTSGYPVYQEEVLIGYIEELLSSWEDVMEALIPLFAPVNPDVKEEIVSTDIAPPDTTDTPQTGSKSLFIAWLMLPLSGLALLVLYIKRPSKRKS